MEIERRDMTSPSNAKQVEGVGESEVGKQMGENPKCFEGKDGTSTGQPYYSEEFPGLFLFTDDLTVDGNLEAELYQFSQGQAQPVAAQVPELAFQQTDPKQSATTPENVTSQAKGQLDQVYTPVQQSSPAEQAIKRKYRALGSHLDFRRNLPITNEGEERHNDSRAESQPLPFTKGDFHGRSVFGRMTGEEIQNAFQGQASPSGVLTLTDAQLTTIRSPDPRLHGSSTFQSSDYRATQAPDLQQAQMSNLTYEYQQRAHSLDPPKSLWPLQPSVHLARATASTKVPRLGYETPPLSRVPSTVALPSSPASPPRHRSSQSLLSAFQSPAQSWSALNRTPIIPPSQEDLQQRLSSGPPIALNSTFTNVYIRPEPAITPLQAQIARELFRAARLKIVQCIGVPKRNIAGTLWLHQVANLMSESGLEQQMLAAIAMQTITYDAFKLRVLAANNFLPSWWWIREGLVHFLVTEGQNVYDIEMLTAWNGKVQEMTDFTEKLTYAAQQQRQAEKKAADAAAFAAQKAEETEDAHSQPEEEEPFRRHVRRGQRPRRNISYREESY